MIKYEIQRLIWIIVTALFLFKAATKSNAMHIEKINKRCFKSLYAPTPGLMERIMKQRKKLSAFTVIGNTMNVKQDNSLKNDQDYSLLHHACAIGDIALVQSLTSVLPYEALLAKNKFHANSQDTIKNQTPLHVALENFHFNIAFHLISLLQVEDLTCQDMLGNTYAHYAAIYGEFEIIKLLTSLLPYEAIFQKNIFEETPLDCAKERSISPAATINYTPIITYLTEYIKK